jgi:hypothetical protein
VAISHVCMECGLDLARVRAAPDPHYGLPMVTCPRCARACVRWHPSRIGWRGARRVRRAAVGLAAQVVILLGSAAITTIASMSMAVERFTPRTVAQDFMAVLRGDEDLLMSGPLVAAGALLGWAVLVGLWLSATLRHLGAPRAILLWGAGVQVLILASGIVQLAADRADPQPAHAAGTVIAAGGAVVDSSPMHWRSEEALGLWPRVAAAAGLITLLTLAGLPVGMAARTSLDRRRSRRMAKARRRQRLGRARA